MAAGIPSGIELKSGTIHRRRSDLTEKILGKEKFLIK